MFINFINTDGGGGGGEAYSALNETFIEVIDRSVSGITLPDGLTSVGENAFASCSALTEVTIPASVTSIEANAFAENRSLSNITFEGDTPPSVASDAFSQLPSSVTVNVPEGSEDAYSAITEDIEDSTAFIVEYTDLSGNTTVWYSKYSSITYDDATNPQPTAPEAGWAKIETKGVKSINHNGMLFEPSVEYVFDENLHEVGCTILRGGTPTKAVFKSTSYSDYQYDGRVGEGCTALSSITFNFSGAPLMNTEHANIGDTAASGILYVPEGGKNYGIYRDRVCGSGWTINNFSGQTMGMITITKTGGTVEDYCYTTPPASKFDGDKSIVSAVLDKNMSTTSSRLFAGLSGSKLSSVTFYYTDSVTKNGCLLVDTCLNGNYRALKSVTYFGKWNYTGNPFSGWRSGTSGDFYIEAQYKDDFMTWYNSNSMFSGWTINEMSGQTTSPYCEIDSTDWIRDYGVRIKVGTSPAPIRIMYNDEQALTIVDGRILYMQPIGEFSVNYDAENDNIVVIENNSQEPITQQQREAMDEYVGINYDSDYGFIGYDFADTDTITVDNNDYTGLYTYCEYME